RAPAAGQTRGVFHRLETMRNVAVCCTSIWNVHIPHDSMAVLPIPIRLLLACTIHTVLQCKI
ncbi:hypothetical protein, partial [Prevotella nigrescens]|uniref:hypothetical protein n=1 Tax=Prevotella nigrescens TaxID=28133 RepID=UPI0028D54273